MLLADFRPKSSTEPSDECRQEVRKNCAKSDYQPPRLTEFGDVRDVVLGISPGIGDSANPGILKA